MRNSAAPAIFLWLAQTDPLVLRARWVIDVESGRAIENGSVAVDGDRIQAQARAGARVIDLGDLAFPKLDGSGRSASTLRIPTWSTPRFCS